MNGVFITAAVLVGAIVTSAFDRTALEMLRSGLSNAVLVAKTAISKRTL